MVQSRASMLRFSERSSMHHAVCCFLMNVDARHEQDDDHISLDNDQMEDLLHEVRGILTSNDLLSVAASMVSIIKYINIAKERAVQSRYMVKHCSYRHSDFLLVDSPFNIFYRVTPFKQAQTVYTKKIK